MKTLSQKEWVAVVVAVFVIGFFFIFGEGLVSYFNNNKITMIEEGPEVLMEDTAYGTGDGAMAGNRITVHYVGRFVDGTIFDSSVARKEPFQFVLGSGAVIKGWDEGILGMRVGGKRTLTIPPELGYGMSDYGPIACGSTLIFEVELLKVEQQ